MSRLGDNLDIPYEDNPPGQTMTLDDASMSGGMIAIAAVIPVDGEAKPAIIFRFAKPEGQFYSPMVLVLDDDQAVKVKRVISAAVSAAVEKAREANRRAGGAT